MRLRGEVERQIYATTFALRLNERIASGYPQAWREADFEAGRPAGSHVRLEQWEHWCADLATDSAETAVVMHRDAVRRRQP